jgi:uncharacterized membrane protein
MGSREFRLLLPTGLRHLPADLAAVTLFTLATVGVVFGPWISETPLRLLVGLPFVLFLPGYAFVSALFPEAGGDADEAEEAATADATATDSRFGVDTARSGIDGIERLALSFGTSLAIVPLLGLALNFTPWGIRLTPIMVTVGGFTLGATAVAARRRATVPVDERFSVPYRSWIDTGRNELLHPETRADSALNILLVVSVLLALGSVSYAVAVPPEGEQFSELYLLTEDDDGELVADGYPSELVAGEPTPLVVGIGNNQQESTEYTVVVQLQRVEAVGGENQSASGEPVNATETQVVDRERMNEFSTQLEHNETWQQEHELRPTMTGENLRVQYLLYTGEPPAEPTADTAYRTVHLWVDVVDRESATVNES